MSLSKLLHSQTFWILSAFVVLGFILRIFSFDSITFGYDQARDAITASHIWKGDLKILGPTSDISGLHHGILYWYLISPFYYFSGSNPYVVKLFLILVSLTIIPLSFLIAQNIFKNKSISYLTAFLCAISFELIEYSKWLANPTLAVVTIALSFLFLWKYTHGYKYGLFFVLFFWGLSVHFEIFLLYQIAVFAVILIVFRKIKIFDIIISLCIAGVVLSPFLLAEIHFKFAATKGIFSFFHGYAGSRGQTFNEMIARVTDKVTLITFHNVLSSYGASFALVMIVGLFSIYKAVFEKDKRILFLFLWFVFPALLFFVGATNIYFAFIGSAVPFIILVAYYIDILLISKKAYGAFALVLVAMIFSNAYLLSANAGQGERLFSVQQGMTLSDEKAAIDWIYKEAQGKPFRIDTITNPLFINTTWSFLFDWYGKNTYGYMPFYWGYPQDGRIGDDIAYSTNFNGSKSLIFFIIEPHGGIPEFYVDGLTKFEDTRSLVQKTKQFGHIVVEKRAITHDLPFSMEQVNTIITGN